MICTRNKNWSRISRHGVTIFEVVIAISLLTVAMVGMTQLIVQVDRTHRALDLRDIALSELANRAARCQLLDAESSSDPEATTQTIRDWPLSPGASASLKNPAWDIQIIKGEDSPKNTAISLKLTFDDAIGNRRPVGPIMVWLFEEPHKNNAGDNSNREPSEESP